jgi:hypothetical protein
MGKQFDNDQLSNIRADVRDAARKIYDGFHGHPCARVYSGSHTIILTIKIVHETYVLRIRVSDDDSGRLTLDVHAKKPFGDFIGKVSFEDAMEWAARASLWPTPTLPERFGFNNGKTLIKFNSGKYHMCQEFLYNYYSEIMWLPGDVIGAKNLPATFDFESVYLAVFKKK